MATMNIEDFVKEALLAIVRGVEAAQADPSSGAMIGRLPAGTVNGVSFQFDNDKNLVGFVEFDLATTVDTLAGGKAGITIFGGGIGAEGHSQSTAVNRIKFVVPVGVPAPAAQRKQLLDRDAEEKRRAEEDNRLILSARATRI
jgi:hypothetical protein